MGAPNESECMCSCPEYMMNMNEEKLASSGERFEGFRTTSSLYSGLETLASTGEIDLEAEMANAQSNNGDKRSFFQTESDGSTLSCMKLTAKRVRDMSLLFHIEKSLLLGTIGVSFKSLGLALGVFGGRYWNVLFLLYVLLSIPIYCFSTRHDYLNRLFIFLNSIFSMFSLFLLAERSATVVSSHMTGILLERRTEVCLVIDMVMLVGTAMGMIVNSVNSCRLRRVVGDLEKECIDSCLGHRVISKIKHRKGLVRDNFNSSGSNCVNSISS